MLLSYIHIHAHAYTHTIHKLGVENLKTLKPQCVQKDVGEIAFLGLGLMTITGKQDAHIDSQQEF